MGLDATKAGKTGRPIVERTLEDAAWRTLVDSVLAGECTPFLGAGVAYPHLPTGKQLATALAKEYKYPLSDITNLPRVAQYIATIHQPAYAKRRVRERIAAAQQRFVESSGEEFPRNFRLLAKLGLSIYITTNYDEFLEHALASAGRTPHVQICRWNDQLCDELDKYSKAEPTADKPLIFYLHGKLGNDTSILVTEDDYIDFTVSLALRDPKVDPVIPHWIRRALSRTTLLFIGYSLEDWNFRVLLRHLMKQQKLLRVEQPFSLSIQLSDPNLTEEQRDGAEGFLSDYLGTAAIRVHWGDASPFLTELNKRVLEEQHRRERAELDDRSAYG